MNREGIGWNLESGKFRLEIEKFVKVRLGNGASKFHPVSLNTLYLVQGISISSFL